MIDLVRTVLRQLNYRIVTELSKYDRYYDNSSRCYYSESMKSKKLLFEEIVSHNAVKRIFIKALLSSDPVHILLVGTPGSAKTMFLTEIIRCFKSSLFIVGSNSTKAGLINQMFEKTPKILLIDELDKMNSSDQTSLLNLMEAGLIYETKINKTRELKLAVQVFATANSSHKVIEPLLSGFVVLQLPDYTFEEFKEIPLSRLENTKIDKYTATSIIEQVWNELPSKDIRRCS